MCKTIYIVGGGPSLYGYDWNLLKEKNIIGINRAFEVVPWADFIYFTDYKFFIEYQHKGLLDVDSILATVDDRIRHTNVMNFINSGVNGIDTSKDCLRVGKNSGHAAINLAVHLGAKRIVLLGFDMCTEQCSVTRIRDKKSMMVSGRSHWHEGYKTGPNLGTYPTMLRHFPSLVDPLKELGIEVLNASPRSKLEIFPKISLGDAHLVDKHTVECIPRN